MSVKVCAVDGCDSTVLARGWCNTHYKRWYRSGEVGTAEPGRGGRPRAPIPHGEFRGYYQAHRRRGEEPCMACSDARNVYMQSLRDADPNIVRRATRRAKARQRAAFRLADRYPTEFAALLREEMQEVAAEAVAS